MNPDADRLRAMLTFPPSVGEAIAHLRAARDILKATKSVRSLAKVRACLKSAEGAQRHADGLATRRHWQEEIARKRAAR